jgi:hypothetical protein
MYMSNFLLWQAIAKNALLRDAQLLREGANDGPRVTRYNIHLDPLPLEGFNRGRGTGAWTVG